MKGKGLPVVFFIVLICGCATLGARFATKDVAKAVELINSQDAAALSLHSGKQFIFDGEILLRSADIHAVWSNLSDSGFSFINPFIVETFASDETTYRIFSDSEEMRILFDRYIPAGSTVGKIATDDGTYHLLLGSRSGGYPAILGITGF